MRILLKHVLKSMQKKPLQPFVILLTLVISFAVMTSATVMGDAISEEVAQSARAENGGADLTVSLTGSSVSRFMFTDDVRAVLGDGVTVGGYYELPMSVFGGTEFGAAADFGEIGSIFSLGFTEYGCVTTAKRDTSAFITRALAERLGASVGDTVELNFFGKDKAYTVEGISEISFMGKYSVLIDIRGAMRVLAEDSFMASVLGEEFCPCSKILIDVPDGADINEYAARLKASERFSDKNVTDVKSLIAMTEGNNYLDMVVDFAILFATILSVSVIFSCLFILSAERSEANILLFAAGVRRSVLRALQFGELMMYWLISLPLGALLSKPLTTLMSSACGLVYTKTSLDMRAIVTSSAFSLISTVLAMLAFWGIEFKNARGRVKSGNRATLTVAVALCLIFVILTFTLPGRLPMLFGSVSMVMLFAVFALSSRKITDICIQLFAKSKKKRIFDGKHTGNTEVYYALKNLHSVKVLHNVERLFALLTAIVISVSSITSGAQGCIKTLEGIFSADYAVMNVTEGGEELIKKCESVQKSGRAFIGTASHKNGFTCAAISAEDISQLSDELQAVESPTGSDAVVSYGYCKMFSLDLGDNFCAEIDGERLELRVSKIVRSDLSVIIFNAVDNAVSENVILVSGGDRVAMSSELSEALSEQIATVVECKDIFRAKVDGMRIYCTFGNLLLLIVVLFASIGFIDNVRESYRARREEFSLYSLSGMNRGQIARMKCFELSAVVTFGTLLGVALFFCAYAVMNEAFLSLAYDFSASLKRAFK